MPERTAATNQQLLEIMLAQDFQDLTGQVIKKITDVVYLIEQQLLSVLVENIAPERREQFAASAAVLMSLTGAPKSLMNSPQINPEGKSDVVQDRSQVDDLLASLDFSGSDSSAGWAQSTRERDQHSKKRNAGTHRCAPRFLSTKFANVRTIPLTGILMLSHGEILRI